MVPQLRSDKSLAPKLPHSSLVRPAGRLDIEEEEEPIRKRAPPELPGL